MVYRNGIVADALRPGTPYSVIFGLQVPQLAGIARAHPQDPDLAMALWNDSKVRESRLLAVYLLPPAETTIETALALARSVQTREEADMLAFRLLKRMSNPSSILAAMEADSSIPEFSVDALRNHLS